MAHRLQNRIVKLNWARDEQGGMRGLGRHGLCCLLRRFFFDFDFDFGSDFYLAVLVFNVRSPLCGKWSVEFEERFGVQVPGEEVEAGGGARGSQLDGGGGVLAGNKRTQQSARGSQLAGFWTNERRGSLEMDDATGGC